MAKTLSFAAVHFTVAFGVGYLLTGSVLVGSLLALAFALIGSLVWLPSRRRRPVGTRG